MGTLADVRAASNMAERIKALREWSGMSGHEFGALFDVDQSTISKWERGVFGKHKDEPSDIDVIIKMADMARMSLDEFRFRKPAAKKASSNFTVRVVGHLQAGDWREAIEWDFDDQYERPAPVLKGLPDVPLKGFEVVGSSMDKRYPEGSLVFVANAVTSGLKIENGRRVLVSRRNADGLYEATIKKYVVDDDGSKWLWPESNDPMHQAPIRYNGRNSEEVTITGIVVASTTSEI